MRRVFFGAEYPWITSRWYPLNVTAVVTEAADAERVLSPRKDTPANDVVANDDDMALISCIRCFFENVQQTYFIKRTRTRPTKLLQSFSET
jgi:hypothetical protein